MITDYWEKQKDQSFPPFFFFFSMCFSVHSGKMRAPVAITTLYYNQQSSKFNCHSALLNQYIQQQLYEFHKSCYQNLFEISKQAEVYLHIRASLKLSFTSLLQQCTIQNALLCPREHLSWDSYPLMKSQTKYKTELKLYV